jgi:pimeloyl-ACP methyl ester carboxylesterase
MRIGTRPPLPLAPHDHPALVLWGRRDPYLPAELAECQRDAFPSARVEVLVAGHWPFVDDVDRVAARLTGFPSGRVGARVAV